MAGFFSYSAGFPIWATYFRPLLFSMLRKFLQHFLGAEAYVPGRRDFVCDWQAL